MGMAENFTKLLAVIIPQLRHCLVWTLIANAIILPTALVADLEKNRRWHHGNSLGPRLIHMLFAVVEPVQQGMLSSVVVTVVLLSWSRTLWGMWKPFNTSWSPHEGDMQIVGVVLLCAFVAVQVYIRIRYKPQRVMHNRNYITRALTWDHRALRSCEKCWGLTRNMLLLPLRFLVNVVDVPFTILCSGIALNTYVFMAKFSSFAWPWVKQTAYQKVQALPSAGKLFYIVTVGGSLQSLWSSWLTPWVGLCRTATFALRETLASKSRCCRRLPKPRIAQHELSLSSLL